MQLGEHAVIFIEVLFNTDNTKALAKFDKTKTLTMANNPKALAKEGKEKALIKSIEIKLL